MKTPDSPELKLWNKALSEQGLPEIKRNERIPAELVTPEAEDVHFNDEMEHYLDLYDFLPLKVKMDIIDDLNRLRAEGRQYSEILDRLEVLADLGTELIKMTSNDSDKKHTPKLPSAEEEIEKEKRDTDRSISELINRLERSAQKDAEPPKPERKKVN